MNHTSLRRRLFAGAAGLMLGAAGALAVASPASAHAPVVSGNAVCDTATGEFVVTWTVKSTPNSVAGTVDTVTVVPTEPTLSVIVPGAALPEAGTGELTEQQRLPGDTTTPASLAVAVDFPSTGEEDISASAEVPLDGTCKKKENGEGGEKPPELPEGIVFPAATCDFLIFFVVNEEVEEGVSFAFTPNQDAVHGHGPDFVGFAEQLRDNPGSVVEIPDDASLETEGEGVGEIAAGETAGPFGPFGPGDAFPAGDRHAHGFEAFDGLEVEVDVFIGQGEDAELVLEQTVAWDDEGLNCEEDGEDGEGGELPETGASTGMIAAGAAAMLALGGGLFLLARRRRVTFTA